MIADARHLWHRHPAVRTGDQLSAGERAADAAVRGMGSWAFLAAQTIFIAVWVVANVYFLLFAWDRFPFILLNLMFSVQAAYAAPLILLASRRQDAKNAAVSVHTSDQVDRIDNKVDTVLSKLDELLETDRSGSR